LSAPASGTLATLAGTEQLTNKDIDGGVASDVHRLTLPSDTLANLTALTRKEATIWYATDTDQVYKDDGAVLSPVAGSSSSSSVNVRASEGAGTTTFTNADPHNQRFDLSANRIAVLPTTGVVKGDVWELNNPNPWQLAIQASDASLIVNSWGSDVVLVALINTPVSSADWSIVQHDVVYGAALSTYTPTISAGTVTSMVNVGWERPSIETMHIHGYITFGAGSSGSNSLSVSFPAPNGTPLTFDSFIQGQGENLGPATFRFFGALAPNLFGGFVTVSGAGTATDITFYSGYTANADVAVGGNSAVVPLLEGYPSNTSYLSFDAHIRITEWKVS
jgi:hypothetical protein